MIVYLKQPVETTKVFGIKRPAKTVLFFVDEPGNFLMAAHAALLNIKHAQQPDAAQQQQ